MDTDVEIGCCLYESSWVFFSSIPILTSNCFIQAYLLKWCSNFTSFYVILCHRPLCFSYLKHTTMTHQNIYRLTRIMLELLLFYAIILYAFLTSNTLQWHTKIYIDWKEWCLNYCYLSCILVDCWHVTQSSLVGLVTINYKCFTNIWQVRPSVTFMVSEPCDCCHATGRVEALETSFFKIEQQICRVLVSRRFLSQNFVLAIRSWGEKKTFHESCVL